MNKHSKSLFVSLLIHSLLLGIVFYLYTTATTYIGRSKEKRVCIKLGTIHQIAAKKSLSVKKEQNQDKKLINKIEKLKKPQKTIEKKKHPIQKVKTKQKKKTPLKKKVKVKKKIEKKKEVIKKEPPQKVVQAKELNIAKKERPDTNAATQEVCSKTSDKKAIEKEKTCKNDSPALHTTQKQSAKDKYVNQHLQEIARLLQENLYYPRRARKRGIEGKVTVRFTLKKSAEVVSIEVISSNNEILSRGAIKTLQNLSGQFPNPDEKLILTVPISYRLNR